MLLRHSALYLAGRGIPGLLSFAALAVFSRLLTPDEYGVYALVIAAVGLADVLLLQWLRLGLLRFLPSQSVPRAALLGTVLTATLLVATAATVIGVIALLTNREESVGWGLALAGIAMLWLQALFELNQEFTRAELSPARYGAAATARALLSLGIGTGLVVVGWGPIGPVIGLAAAYAMALLLFGRRKGWSPREYDPSLIRTLVSYGGPLALTAALAFVVNSSDRFLLAALASTATAGEYAVGYDFAQFTIGMLMLVVNLAAFPLAVRSLERDGVKAASEQLGRNFVLLLGVGAPAATGMALLAPNLTGVFLGASFQEAAARVVPLIAFVALLAGMKSFYVDLGFQLGNRTVGQIWVMAGAASVNLVLNVAWIPRLGLDGAVYATVVAYLVAIVSGWWLARRSFPLPMPVGATGRVLSATAFMALVVTPTRDWDGAWALAAQVSLGAAAYLIAIALAFGPTLWRRKGDRAVHGD